MNELRYLYDKYKERDIIELDGEKQVQIVEWASGTKLAQMTGQIDVRSAAKRLCERGFIKFLNKGVIFITHKRSFRGISIYPFEFTDAGTCRLSVYISNPHAREVPDFMTLLCKVEFGTDTLFRVIDNTLNVDLASEHVIAEIELQKANMGTLEPIIAECRKMYPKLDPNGKEFIEKISRMYLETVVKAQIISVITINAYFVLLDKEQLVSRIKQEKVMTASNKTEAKRSKRSLTYRYTVNTPPNYKPRKFNLNYLLEDWEREGHTRLMWVRKENEEKLKERHNGESAHKVKGDLVGIRIPVQPQTCHRRIADTAGEHGTKVYNS